MNFDVERFSKKQLQDEFFSDFKYITLLIVSLIFLTNNPNLYKSTSIRVKDICEEFLFFLY